MRDITKKNEVLKHVTRMLLNNIIKHTYVCLFLLEIDTQ